MITNPLNGRKYSIYSNKGKQLLKYYIDLFKSEGGASRDLTSVNYKNQVGGELIGNNKIILGHINDVLGKVIIALKEGKKAADAKTKEAADAKTKEAADAAVIKATTAQDTLKKLEVVAAEKEEAEQKTELLPGAQAVITLIIETNNLLIVKGVTIADDVITIPNEGDYIKIGKKEDNKLTVINMETVFEKLAKVTFENKEEAKKALEAAAKIEEAAAAKIALAERKTKLTKNFELIENVEKLVNEKLTIAKAADVKEKGEAKDAVEKVNKAKAEKAATDADAVTAAADADADAVTAAEKALLAYANAVIALINKEKLTVKKGSEDSVIKEISTYNEIEGKFTGVTITATPETAPEKTPDTTKSDSKDPDTTTTPAASAPAPTTGGSNFYILSEPELKELIKDYIGLLEKFQNYCFNINQCATKPTTPATTAE